VLSVEKRVLCVCPTSGHHEAGCDTRRALRDAVDVANLLLPSLLSKFCLVSTRTRALPCLRRSQRPQGVRSSALRLAHEVDDVAPLSTRCRFSRRRRTT
jgi:hypothetical protein